MYFRPILTVLKLYEKPRLLTLVAGDDCCLTLDAKKPSKAVKAIQALKNALSKTCFLSNNFVPGIALKNINTASQFTSVVWRHIL